MKQLEDKEITFSDIVISMLNWLKYLFSKWILLVIVIIIGIVLGWFYSYISGRKYIAESNFVLESSTSAPALPFGLGLGTDPSAGLFNSLDNIIWLYSSKNMLEKALLSSGTFKDNKNKILINEFIETSSLIKDYLKDNPKFKDIRYKEDQSEFTNDESVFLGVCINFIKSTYLEVMKVDKTENIISVKTEAEEEFFTYNFTVTLVQIVNEFYISTKAKKSIENVASLELKADSLRKNLNKSMVTTASKIDNVPYANPNLSVLRVEPQKSNIDVQANTGLYLQVIQSLESARNELNKEKPIIQIVDMPRLPLNSKGVNKKMSMAIGGILALFLISVFIIIRKIFLDILKNKKTKIN